MHRIPRRLMCGLLAACCLTPAMAQFRDDFDNVTLAPRHESLDGWSYRTGDGRALISFEPGDGFASVKVDATDDTLGIWWAFIRRHVSTGLDIERLNRPGQELRIEARIRSNTAPRRVNLHVNTPSTTDFHSHLREYDIAEPDTWYTISMTTQDFQADASGRIFAQMALIDWGLGRYQVDIDYFKVDVVDAATAGPDLGTPLVYRPPVPDLATLKHAVPVAGDATVDLAFPELNLNNWSVTAGGTTTTVLSVNDTQNPILRWDLSAFAGRKVAGWGVLEIATHSVARPAERTKDFGMIHVVEILGGDPAWDENTVTLASLCQGRPLTEVFNTQMFRDIEVEDEPGGKTLIPVSQPVLQRLIDGRTRGIAIRPLGAIGASFLARENDGGRAAATLRFNLEE